MKKCMPIDISKLFGLHEHSRVPSSSERMQRTIGGIEVLQELITFIGKLEHEFEYKIKTKVLTPHFALMPFITQLRQRINEMADDLESDDE